MSTVKEVTAINPYGDSDNILKLNIDSSSDSYVLQDVIKLPSTYTFSIWYRTESDSQITFNVLGESEIIDSTTTWNKFVKTVTVETLEETSIYIIPSVGVNSYFYEGYLVEGIVDTSWLPAPEDIEGEISSVRSELIQTADRIEAKITASDGRITSLATDLEGITARVEDAEGNITSLTADLEGVKSRVEDAEGNITQLQQTSEEISLKAGNAERLAIESKVLSVNLSVETMTVATDTGGNNGAYSNCKTTVSVSYGVDDVTSSSTITCTPANGVTGNLDSSTNVYTITDMTVDTGTVDINVTYVATIDGVEQTLSTTRTFSVSKSKQGVKGDRGLQGLQGEQGDQGIPGKDGSSSYTHIAYANSADGQTDFSVSDSDRSYIGMYVDDQETDSTNPDDYAWTLVKGADGANGTPGKAGEDGKTPYLHIAYANSEDGVTDFSVTDSTDKTYIGQYTDYTEADSTDPTSYQWSKIKGDDGISVKSIATEYYLSTSETSVTGGSWSTTPPEKTDTTYIWRREHTVYDDDTESYSSPVLDQSLNQLFVVTAELTVGQDEIRSEVKSVKTEVGNLVYDNRNYVRDSGNFVSGKNICWTVSGTAYMSLSVNDGYARISLIKADSGASRRVYIPLSEELEQSAKYTISMRVRRNSAYKLTIRRYYSTGSASGYGDLIRFDASKFIDGEWVDLSATVTTPSTNNYSRLFIAPESFKNVDDYIDIEWIKLENGEKATRWEPAPEDVAADIDNVRFDTNAAIVALREEVGSQIDQSAESIKMSVYDKVYVKDEVDSMVESISTEYEQTKTGWEYTFNQFKADVDDIANGNDAKFEEIKKYIRFEDGNILLGNSESPLVLKIQNDRIQFLQNGYEVAYISDRKMYNTICSVIDRLEIGDSAWQVEHNEDGDTVVSLVPIY